MSTASLIAGFLGAAVLLEHDAEIMVNAVIAIGKNNFAMSVCICVCLPVFVCRMFLFVSAPGFSAYSLCSVEANSHNSLIHNVFFYAALNILIVFYMAK